MRVSVKGDLLETSVDSNSTVNGDCEVNKEVVTKIHRSSSWLQSKWRRIDIVEVIVMSFVILLAWGLFALTPAVLYTLSPQQVRVLLSYTVPVCGTACLSSVSGSKICKSLTDKVNYPPLIIRVVK